MSDLEAWRRQLAQENDSDDDDAAAPIHFDVPADTDLGLALDEMPLPSRVPQAANLLPAAEPARAAMPPRAGQGPPAVGHKMRSLGMHEASNDGGERGAAEAPRAGTREHVQM